MAFARRTARGGKRLLGCRRGGGDESLPGGERRGEEEGGDAADRQEGRGPSASAFPSARIRTSSSWKKSDVARMCSGVLSA